MQIDRRITNGLAWAGVVLVVGIPLADMVTAQIMGDQSKPAQVAMIAPVAPVAPVPVALSERPAPPVVKPVATAAVKPAAVVTPAAVSKPTVVAQPAAPVATVQQPVAPTAAMQTAAVAAPTQAAPSGDVVSSYLQTGKALPAYITGAPGAPATSQAAAPAATPASVAPPATDPFEVAALGPAKDAPVPMPLSMRPEPVLIVEGPPASRDFQAGADRNPRSSATVTYDDLQDWESGPLSEFLARRQGGEQIDPDYDPDGFFLDQGPNGAPRRDRLIGPADDVFFPFVN